MLRRAFFRPSSSRRSDRHARTCRAIRSVRTLREVKARTGVMGYLVVARRDAGPGMTTRAEGREPERVWRRLRENPDYVADWRASAGPTFREAPPYAFRRQTEADRKAVRWNLLAWEDPRHPLWAELFWAHVAMVEARVAEPGEHAWPRLLRRAGATFTGLRLLDGALVLKVWRGHETGQIRVFDGAAFDPAHSGLEVAMRQGVRARSGWVLVNSLDGIVFRR